VSLKDGEIKMAEMQKVDVSAEEVERAQSMWDNFMAVSKVSTILIGIILFLLYLGFIAF
jgi:hypothetical protein